MAPVMQSWISQPVWASQSNPGVQQHLDATLGYSLVLGGLMGSRGWTQPSNLRYSVIPQLQKADCELLLM